MAWSEDEVDPAVDTYLELYKRQLRGEEFVKAEYHRDLSSRLARTPSAVEYKFQNISAVLSEMGYPRMDGYAPYGNYQKLLLDRVGEHLSRDQELHDLLDEEAAGRPDVPRVPTPIEDIVESPPEGGDGSLQNDPTDGPKRRPKKINYVKRERRNRDLGRAGEEFALGLERRRLKNEGRPELADKIEWTAEERGDGLGYDILSFDSNGESRYVEVKTTKQGRSLPFYLTANELRFSEEADEQFYVYRLYKFSSGNEPRLYVLNGSVGETCQLTPDSFRARPGK